MSYNIGIPDGVLSNVRSRYGHISIDQATNIIREQCDVLQALYQSGNTRSYWSDEDTEIALVVLQNKMVHREHADSITRDMAKCEKELEVLSADELMILDNLYYFLDFVLTQYDETKFNRGIDNIIKSYTIAQVTVLQRLVRMCQYLSGGEITNKCTSDLFLYTVCNEILQDAIQQVTSDRSPFVASRLQFASEKLMLFLTTREIGTVGDAALKLHHKVMKIEPVLSKEVVTRRTPRGVHTPYEEKAHTVTPISALPEPTLPVSIPSPPISQTIEPMKLVPQTIEPVKPSCALTHHNTEIKADRHSQKKDTCGVRFTLPCKSSSHKRVTKPKAVYSNYQDLLLEMFTEQTSRQQEEDKKMIQDQKIVQSSEEEPQKHRHKSSHRRHHRDDEIEQRPSKGNRHHHHHRHRERSKKEKVSVNSIPHQTSNQSSNVNLVSL